MQAADSVRTSVLKTIAEQQMAFAALAPPGCQPVHASASCPPSAYQRTSEHIVSKHALPLHHGHRAPAESNRIGGRVRGLIGQISPGDVLNIVPTNDAFSRLGSS